MFYADDPERLPWDYFLTEYERDLLTLALEEIVRKNPDKATDELKAEMEIMRASQSVFDGKT